MLTIRFHSTVLSLIVFTNIIAQSNFENAKRISDPVWTVNTGLRAAQDKETWDGKQDTDIEWLKVTASGRLIIASTQGLLTYDPNDGKTILDTRTMSNTFSGFSANSYREIPNSPFFSLKYVKFVGRTDHFIVNSIDGKFLGSNDLVGVSKVMERYVLPLSGSVLFVGRSNMGMKSGLGSKNLITGKTWSQDDIFTWKMIEHRIAGVPLEVSKTEVLIPMESALYCLNSETGELKWRTYISVFSSDDFGTGMPSGSSSKPAPKSTSSKGMSSGGSNADESVEVSVKLFKHPTKPIVYVINPNGITAFDIATGKEVWKRVRKADINSQQILTKDGIVICTDKIYLYDYETGEIKYDKPRKFGGEVHLFDYTADGIILGIHKLDRKQQSYYELNILDPKTGNLKFEEPFETNGLLTEFWPCETGIFYTTDRALGVWDKNTGKNAFEPVAATSKKRNIFNYESQQAGYVEPANGSLLTVFNESLAYVFNTEVNQLYKIDSKAGTNTQLTSSPLSNIRPDQIELRSNGVLLTSAQKMTLVGFDGKVIYDKDFKAPGYTLFAKIVAVAALVYDSYREQQDPIRQDQMDRNMNANIEYAFDQAGFNRVGPVESKIQIDVEGSKAIIHDRFELSKTAKDYHFINTQLASKRDDGENEFGLVMVNKNTGEVDKVFPFGKNRAPQFTIDEVSQKMFYLEGDKLHCYQL